MSPRSERGGVDESESVAGIRVLHALASADGAAPGGDRDRALRVIADASGVHLNEAPEAVTLDAELALLRSPDVVRRTVRAALAITAMAEERSPAGQRILDKVHAALDRTGAGLAPEDVARVEEVQGALARATEQFLHEVARASSEEKLSLPSYLSLVRELDAKKEAALRTALVSEPPPK